LSPTPVLRSRANRPLRSPTRGMLANVGIFRYALTATRDWRLRGDKRGMFREMRKARVPVPPVGGNLCGRFNTPPIFPNVDLSPRCKIGSPKRRLDNLSLFARTRRFDILTHP
jgi:hypothetical protein